MHAHHDRTIAVTGSASGIGRATADLLQQKGTTVVGIDRHDADVVADLSTSAGRQTAVEWTLAASGGLNGVVASAGLGLPGPAAPDIVSVNFFGVCDVLTSLRPRLAGNDRAHAVVIVSNAAATVPDVPNDLLDAMLAGDESTARDLAVRYGDLAAYATSKLAVARWLRQAAPSHEWAGSGIRLNGIGPGLTRTPMLQVALDQPGTRDQLDLIPIPLGRLGEADEVAALADVLLSPVADYLVGQLIFLDGGTEALLRATHWPASWSVIPEASRS